MQLEACLGYIDRVRTPCDVTGAASLDNIGYRTQAGANRISARAPAESRRRCLTHCDHLSKRYRFTILLTLCKHFVLFSVHLDDSSDGVKYLNRKHFINTFIMYTQNVYKCLITIYRHSRVVACGGCLYKQTFVQICPRYANSCYLASADVQPLSSGTTLPGKSNVTHHE